MKIIVLKDNELKFTQRMIMEGYLACKKDNSYKLKDKKMIKILLKKFKCIDKRDK